jgi:hypothetical protein
MLESIGVRRRPDPFAHLAGRENGASGWLQARIEDCLRRGLCPLCDARDSSLSDYLFWLPANLRDADYFLSLYEKGGFCPEHLKLAMASLRRFPYGRVRLFTLQRMLLEEGRFASNRSCHLCRTLEQTQQAYKAALMDICASAGGARDSKALTSCLCRSHAEPLQAALPAARSGWEPKPRKLKGMERRGKPALIRALNEITRDYHSMNRRELESKLDRCEALLREVIPPNG